MRVGEYLEKGLKNSLEEKPEGYSELGRCTSGQGISKIASFTKLPPLPPAAGARAHTVDDHLLIRSFSRDKSLLLSKMSLEQMVILPIL